MKRIKIILLIINICFVIMFFKLLNFEQQRDNSYKVDINRIQNEIELNIDKYIKTPIKIYDGEYENKTVSIKKYKLLNTETASYDDKSNFFNNLNPEKNKVRFIPIENTPLIVKYYIDAKQRTGLKNLLIFLTLIIPIISNIYIIIYIRKHYINPVKKLSGIPEKIASGYIEDLRINSNEEFTKEFVWGLDLLKEELKKEKKRRNELEKEKNTVIASLSHDIKTPLASIKNYSISILDEIYVEPNEIKKAVEVIIEKSDVIENLTKKLIKTKEKDLAYDYKEIQRKEIYFSEIYNSLDHIITQKIELMEIDYQKKEITDNSLIISNSAAITQVFENIIENAMKYGDKNILNLDHYVEENYQIITIENSGTMVPQNELKYIFAEYYRGSNIKDQPGYGLGLSICKKIMQNLHGDIYAENTNNGFKIYLVFKQVS